MLPAVAEVVLVRPTASPGRLRQQHAQNDIGFVLELQIEIVANQFENSARVTRIRIAKDEFLGSDIDGAMQRLSCGTCSTIRGISQQGLRIGDRLRHEDGLNLGPEFKGRLEQEIDSQSYWYNI